MPGFYQWMIVMTGCAVLDASLGFDGRRILSDLAFLTALVISVNLLGVLWSWWQERLPLGRLDVE